MKKVNDFDIGGFISEELGAYNAEVKKVIKASCKELIERANDEIKAAARKQGKRIKSGRDWTNYISHFRTKKLTDGISPSYVWYVEEPDYRLTHLLENGHALKNGGRARKFPHIIKGANYLEKNAESKIAEDLSNL